LFRKENFRVADHFSLSGQHISSMRIADILIMMDDEPRPRSSSDTRHALTAALVNPGLGACWNQARNSSSAMLLASCSHVNAIRFTKTDKRVCEDCIKTGDSWVHLRLRLECGHVGCCDSSKNKHATKHFHHTQHPLVRSIEPGESWVWRYVDEIVPGEVHAHGFVAAD